MRSDDRPDPAAADRQEPQPGEGPSRRLRDRRALQPIVGFGLALLLALLAAAVQGVGYYRDRTPAPALAAGVGEVVALGGTQVEVTSFTVAPELPAEDPERPPVRGPAGSVLVLVVWVQRIDASVKPDEHFCDTSLVAEDGTVWDEDGDYSYALRRPEALTCGNTGSSPLVADVPREIGTSYVVPARYAGQLSWRLSIDDDRHVVEFRP